MAFRVSRMVAALPKASTGFGGRSSQGSHAITVFGATGMTGKCSDIVFQTIPLCPVLQQLWFKKNPSLLFLFTRVALQPH